MELSSNSYGSVNAKKIKEKLKLGIKLNGKYFAELYCKLW